MLRPIRFVSGGGIAGAALIWLARSLLEPPPAVLAPTVQAFEPFVSTECAAPAPSVVELLGDLQALAPPGSGYLVTGLVLLAATFFVGFLVGLPTGIALYLHFARVERRPLPPRIAAYHAHTD